MDPIVDRYFEAEKNGVKTSLQATELIAPDWIDFTHHDYIVIDGKFYTFAYIPSNGFSQRVYAGWVATFVNAGEGIDVDMFFEHMSREAVFNKISTQLRLSRANAMDSHDTDSDYQARMEKFRPVNICCAAFPAAKSSITCQCSSLSWQIQRRNSITSSML